MTMIEKAARALWRADPENYGTEDAMWSSYVDMARAVLLAVREPDEAAVDAAFADMPSDNYGFIWTEEGKLQSPAFTAMIDTILEEPK